MASDDITVQILRDIRDEIRELRVGIDGTNTGLDSTNARLDATNARLDVHIEATKAGFEDLGRRITASEFRTNTTIMEAVAQVEASRTI